MRWFGAGSRPAASNFLLLRQKKVTKEKATLLSASPSLRYGATCGAQAKRGLAQTRLRLKQVPALIRFALRSSAQPEGVKKEYGYQQPNAVRLRPGSCHLYAINSIAAYARIYWAKGTFTQSSLNYSGVTPGAHRFAQNHPSYPPTIAPYQLCHWIPAFARMTRHAKSRVVISSPSTYPNPFPARSGWACAGSKKRDQGRALFEQNAVKRVCAAPVFCSQHRSPAAKRRAPGSRVAFSLLTFFWRSKRK